VNCNAKSSCSLGVSNVPFLSMLSVCFKTCMVLFFLSNIWRRNDVLHFHLCTCTTVSFWMVEDVMSLLQCVTIKLLHQKKTTTKKQGVKNNQLITQKQSVPSQSVLSQLLTFLLFPSSYPAWQEPPG